MGIDSIGLKILKHCALALFKPIHHQSMLSMEIAGTVHCNNSMVVLTNKNGYLNCTFVFSTLGTEQRYKECVRCVGYPPRSIIIMRY